MVTTTITTDAVIDSRPVDREITVPIRKSMNVDDVDSIRRFLAKPRIVATSTWTPATAVGSALFGIQKSFANVVASPAFLDKLTGFTGIRYTTNVKVVLNATPFQQGKLRLVYYPNGGNTLAKYASHVSNRVSLSQLPGVEVTTMQQSAETSVPFLSYQEYYDMTGDRIDPLLYNVHVFSPLENGPNATRPNVVVTLWVWFTDVELFGTSTIDPQSSAKSNVKGKVRTVAAQEERPLSAWLSATSKLAGSLSDVPLISSIAAPTAVWTKYASGVASAFGYSRPIDGQPVRGMAPHYLNSISNADGLNVGSTLALNKDASCRVITDYSPLGKDEMSVNFIKRQWSFIREFSFPVGTASGTQLTEQNLGPNIGISPSTNFGQAVTPTEFLSRLARYYRGGMEICFKFVKTGFHSGTIGISYAVGNTTPTVTLQDTDRLHRTIVDIQDGDSVCLAFPFISSRDWLSSEAYYGRLYVHVINQLVAPETVPQQINIQMYTRGMEDLEYSAYNSTAVIPQLETPIVNQGGLQMEGAEVSNDDEIICQPVGGTLVSPEPNGIQMMDSMSESLTSVLSFLKNGTSVRFYYPSGSTLQLQSFAFNPSAWTVYGRSPTSVFTDPAYLAGPMSAIRSCFAFQRGGYELNILPQLQDRTGDEQRLNTHYVSALHQGGAASVYENDPAGFNTGSFTLSNNGTFLNIGVRVQNPRAMNHGRFGLSATLPYRSKYRVNLIKPAIAGTSYDDDQALARFTVKCQSLDTLLLRPAEDFQLLYWVGVPPMVFV